MHCPFFITLQAIVPMRREPKESSEMVSQLLFGEFGCILETSGSFARIENHFDAYVGWVDAKMILGVSKEEYGELLSSPICRIGQPLVEAPIEQGNSVLRLPGAALLPNYDEGSGAFCFDDRFRGKVSSRFAVEAVVANPAGIAATACLFLNAPYLWGGKNIFGIDCSGLVQVAASINGYLLPRDASQQVEVGRKVSGLCEAVPGNLAFFEKNGKITHVGILLSPESIIHASGHVKIEKIDQEGIVSATSGEYTHRLAAIRSLS